jgi:hypothetical protein
VRAVLGREPLAGSGPRSQGRRSWIASRGGLTSAPSLERFGAAAPAAAAQR